MARRTRHRHLARQAQRRYEERRRRHRRRATAIGVGALIGALAVGIAAFALLRSNPEPRATPTAPTPSPTTSPGTKTGTVTPQPAPEEVACGAKAPPGAGQPKPQFAGPPPLTIDTKKTYTATMKTSCGTITIKLLAKDATQTVNSFVFLAEHHFFDGQYFHRIVEDFVIQGGDPTGTGTGGPGYSIPDELAAIADRPKGEPIYTPGTLAMANSGAPNSGGSQFFIISGPNGTNLDSSPTYTIFGTVIDGMDVVDRIATVPTKESPGGIPGEKSTPTQAVYIDKVTIEVSK